MSPLDEQRRSLCALLRARRSERSRVALMKVLRSKRIEDVREAGDSFLVRFVEGMAMASFCSGIYNRDTGAMANAAKLFDAAHALRKAGTK